MAALKPTVVRQRVAAELNARPGWSESSFIYDLFGREAKTRFHLSFAVGVKNTVSHPNARRQKAGSTLPHLVVTDIEVIFRHQFKIDNQNVSFDAALDEEASAIASVLAATRTDMHISWISTRRDVSDGFVNIIMSFQAQHQIALV